MSTLKVNTLQDASCNNSTTASQIASGRIRAWVEFNGSTDAIRESFNISSISDETYFINTILRVNETPSAWRL